MRKVAFLCLVIVAMLALSGIASAQNGTINPLFNMRSRSSLTEKVAPGAGGPVLLQNGTVNPL